MVYDGAAAGTRWGKIGWTDNTPGGALIDGQMRTAESPAALDLQTYAPVGKNVNFSATGRYIQVRTRLTNNTNNDSPILYALTINGKVLVCDLDGDGDGDGDIDSNDTNLIRAAIGQTVASGDPRDANADGKITINDVRACVLKCTRPKCATK